ncbi:tetratricopeptide repeat protein [Streptomyces sp. NBC_00243]|uniref:tetratricopeptide repeat protein n=1 Tax=Streptomyces sp. NBC_00243 TaxID=2975688 RepID=UPI002DDC0C32|nr:tetratricopeptide repeat protein [Streptomyces sp. NBC_00243]WRZ18993.1 tetratricopeptide repeat protein [Streptomyces sp. NBC_00243]
MPKEGLGSHLERLLAEGTAPGAPDAELLADVLWMAAHVRWETTEPSGGAGAAGPPQPGMPSPGSTPEEPEQEEGSRPGRADQRVALYPRDSPPARQEPAGTAVGPVQDIVDAPRPPSLTNTLALTRALRPLKQYVAAPGPPTLDEDRTARASGDAGILLPSWRQQQERRLSADLIVDTGQTMAIWHRTGTELRDLLERHGAFRDVRCWALDSDRRDPILTPFRSVRGLHAAGLATPSPLSRLADPGGRRLLLILTDGVGPAWSYGSLTQQLAKWAGIRPMAVLQVLPRRLWHRTALQAAPVSAHLPDPALPVPRFRCTAPLPGVPLDSPARNAIAWIPVMEPTADWLAPWVGLLTNRGYRSVPMLAAALSVVDRPGTPSAVTGAAATLSPAEQVAAFREGASPSAFRLACRLAAAPLTLPVMRLVQRAVCPGSPATDLAELFLSGLLFRRVPPQPGEDPEEVLYDFQPGVRHILLGALPVSDSVAVLDVLAKVSDRVARTFGGTLSFPALAAPAETDGSRSQLSGESLPFAEVALTVLESAGGIHRARAEALRARLADRPQQAPLAADASAESLVRRISSLGRARLAGRAALRDSSLRMRGGRGVPLVSDARDPVLLGAHPVAERSQGTPPFVARDVLPEVTAALGSGSTFVLLVGESLAGKTRLAYEAMRERCPTHQLVVPISRQAMVALVEPVSRMKRVVLWLDDLEQYLGAGGLTAGMVGRMLDSPRSEVIILATMSAHQHARIRIPYAADDEPGRDMLRQAREVIRLATTVRVDRRWSAAEIARAQQSARGDSRLAAAVRDASRQGHGVAEFLAAAPALLSDWYDAWAPGTHPRAAALVGAAVDARRAGVHRPLAEDLLRQLHGTYLELRGGSLLRPESWPDALSWACSPARATSSLLLPRAENRYLAFDYLHLTLDERIPPPRIPDNTWRILIEYADPATLLDIGTTAYQRGELMQAMSAFEKAGAEGDRLPRQWYATCLSEAGHAQRAAELYQELVRESEAELGVDAPETLANRNGYARCVGQSGNPLSAAALLEDVVTDRTRVLGPDHAHTLNSRNNLAFFLGTAGDHAQAVDLYEEVLADRTRLLGPDHPHTLSSRYGLAYFIGDSGRPAEAARLFQSLVDDRTRIQGPYHPYTLNNRRHQAHFLGEAGHADEAAGLFATLTQDCLSVLDPNHPDTLASRHGHARFIGEAGAPRQAVLLLERLLEDSEQAGADEPDSPITLLRRRYLAYFYGESGNLARALRLLGDLEADSRRVHREDHPQLFAVREAQARFIGAAGRYAEAVALYGRLVPECIQSLGSDHPQTLSARAGHARSLCHSGRPAEAVELLEALIPDSTRVLGSDHPHTFNNRHLHAYCVGQAGNRDRAERLFELLLHDRIGVFGIDHPGTVETRRELDALW